MTITFFLVTLNHHQVCVADELYRLIGDGFKFVELSEKCEDKGDSTDYSTRDYLICDWLNISNHRLAMSLLLSSDICVFGGYESFKLFRIRAKKGLLSYVISERWLKKGLSNLMSPRLLPQFISYHLFLRNRPVYMLCASAFAARDFSRLYMYKGRCLKWGYFTKVSDQTISDKDRHSNNVTTIMWCARFINWKHPELPILLAKNLKERNIRFSIDMFGDGPEIKRCKKLCGELGVEDLVSFKGAQSNAVILNEMKRHDLFLITSDKNEGWGAVLNEAMASGCAVVASDEIGAAPYLIKDGFNGKVYRSDNVDSLTDTVVSLVNDTSMRHRLSYNAYQTISQEWSPKAAAYNFVHLSDLLLRGQETDIQSGPCSLADY